MTNKSGHSISDDQPLSIGRALQDDQLGRAGFAKAAVGALNRVSATSGFVLSIEGPWGSGKTSTLAMIEQTLLLDASTAPIIVHFNPWLVGDRDALLRQFLEAIATAVKLTDHVGNAKKTSKELKNYAKVFDFVKFVPGAEPWASIVKKLVDAAGDSLEGIADQKHRDIDAQKERVEKELKKLDRPILVFIDDIDRLFPAEVFEMVRIIKAVGDLPHVGYVVAWDSHYVSKALKSASVPNASSYLDKIVQIRLPLPVISFQARLILLNSAIKSLDSEALEPLFPKQQERLDAIYHYGLRNLLEQPRDITRVFNTISVIEPGLRGEVVFADILALASLMVRAPAVYSLLRRERDLFIDKVSDSSSTERGKEELLQRRKKLKAAFAKCESPSAVKEMTCHLFPQVAKALEKFAFDSVNDMEGHLGAPGRLNIALQLSIGISDVSLVDAKNYVMNQGQRAEVVTRLTDDNAMEFLEKLGDVADALTPGGVEQVDDLSLSIARLADAPPYSDMSSKRQAFALNPEDMALRAVNKLITAVDPPQGPGIAFQIATNPGTLSVASQVLLNGWMPTRKSQDNVTCSPTDQARAVGLFVDNVSSSIAGGRFWSTANPAMILWSLARLAPESGPRIASALVAEDPTLDQFALQFMRHSISSDGGQAYKLPEDEKVAGVFFPLSKLKKHAKKRLTDKSVDYPARAAWRSVVEDRAIYGKDGRIARR